MERYIEQLAEDYRAAAENVPILARILPILVVRDQQGEEEMAAGMSAG